MAIIAAIMVASLVYFTSPGPRDFRLFKDLPDSPTPNPTNIPALAALAEQADEETQKAVANYTPKLSAKLDDLSITAADLLKELPGVEKVEVKYLVKNPTACIVHLANWHMFHAACTPSNWNKSTDAS
jgi:hypothetical protein